MIAALSQLVDAFKTPLLSAVFDEDSDIDEYLDGLFDALVAAGLARE